jgi:hypothetical protein
MAEMPNHNQSRVAVGGVRKKLAKELVVSRVLNHTVTMGTSTDWMGVAKLAVIWVPSLDG